MQISNDGKTCENLHSEASCTYRALRATTLFYDHWMIVIRKPFMGPESVRFEWTMIKNLLIFFSFAFRIFEKKNGPAFFMWSVDKNIIFKNININAYNSKVIKKYLLILTQTLQYIHKAKQWFFKTIFSIIGNLHR